MTYLLEAIVEKRQEVEAKKKVVTDWMSAQAKLGNLVQAGQCPSYSQYGRAEAELHEIYQGIKPLALIDLAILWKEAAMAGDTWDCHEAGCECDYSTKCQEALAKEEELA